MVKVIISATKSNSLHILYNSEGLELGLELCYISFEPGLCLGLCLSCLCYELRHKDYLEF